MLGNNHILLQFLWNTEEEITEIHKPNPFSNSKAIECLIKLRSHFQSLGGTEETFLSIQQIEKTLHKKKVEENSKQTRHTDSFPN